MTYKNGLKEALEDVRKNGYQHILTKEQRESVTYLPNWLKSSQDN